MSILSVSGVSRLSAPLSGGPKSTDATLEPSSPTVLLAGPEVEVVKPQAGSYDQLRGYLMSLHISLAPAPAGRETAPPSPKQAAIDAYTGR